MDEYIKVNKDQLINTVNLDHLSFIQDLVLRTNTIVTRAYQFISLYASWCHTWNLPLPVFDTNFISDIFKVITVKTTRAGRPAKRQMQVKHLRLFYNFCYKTLLNQAEVVLDNLNYILPYEEKDIVKNINVNIQEHFLQHLYKWVNLTFKQEKEAIRQVKDAEQRKSLWKAYDAQLRLIKKDLLSRDAILSDEKYHTWIHYQRAKLFNHIPFFHKSMHYMLASEPQTFLPSMFYIHQQLSEMKTDKQIRLFHVLPLRNSLIPRHITLDTAAIIQNFLGPGSTHYFGTYSKNNQQEEIWRQVFDLDNKVFKKNGYQFHSMIKTDGVAVSILFHKHEIKKKYNPKPKKSDKKSDKKKKHTTEEKDVPYIEEIPITDTMRNKRIVCIDPNLSDLIYAGQYTEDRLVTFRYTQNQRRKEMRIKHYRNIRQEMNNTVIDHQTISQIENVLSHISSKTINVKLFREYCQQKNQVNDLLDAHYQQPIFRKLQFNSFVNMQRSESLMLNHFKEHFGPPEETLILMGDFDKQEHFKGVEPTICKKFRRLFKSVGYEVYLINEFRTSILCNGCHEKMHYFHERASHKPKHQGKKMPCHGLLRCQSVKHSSEVSQGMRKTAEIIHNRDKNAVKNMLHIAEYLFLYGKRPERFTRDSRVVHATLH